MSSEPQFRFCTSADGVRIAYATYGEGAPLLYSPSNMGIDDALAIPESRAFLDALAMRVALALYPRRARSETHRLVGGYSSAVDFDDIVAVADSLGRAAHCSSTTDGSAAVRDMPALIRNA